MSYAVPPNISEIRAKAWRTRREKYGPRGHAGSYQRPCSNCEAMITLLIDLHRSGTLSEGQVAKATGLHRIEIRNRCDALDGAGALPTLTWTVETTHGPELRTGTPAGSAPEGRVNPPGLVGVIDAQGIPHWLGPDAVGEVG